MSITEKKKIGIIGAGPVGSILCAHLAKSKEDVALVDMLRERLDAIKKNGLNISGIVKMNAKIEKLCYSIAELDAFDADLIFVAVKASALKNVISELKKIYKPEMKVVSFQNGLDTEELIASAFGDENSLRAVINYAGILVSNENVKMTFFNKPNYIGVLSDKARTTGKYIANIMTKAGLDTEFTENIKKYVWEKTILNAAMSPVCALTKMTMKEAVKFEDTYKIAEELLKEGIAVAESCGYVFDSNFLENCILYLRKAGHHLPSMYHDLEKNRATEIDFLNKKIVEYGKKCNVPTPYNFAVTCLIKGLEIKNMLTKI
ncbi:MAG: ketopantoate reductase family protein [Candidatus Thermoplasmatota archaeon]|nr:ketopantoate reductase family protein [Candidatus Thermoplasmatota archaeon]